MLPGLGILRRGVTLVLLGAAFMAGLKLGQSGQVQACLDAEGTWDRRGFCNGALP
ncbi:hypothetical protein MCELHM10_02459 [Paracoccaceae bacterium]|jgi:hypothetical protein